MEPAIRVVERSLFLPEPFTEPEASASPSGAPSTAMIDTDRARGMFHLLSLAATGLGHPVPETTHGAEDYKWVISND